MKQAAKIKRAVRKVVPKNSKQQIPNVALRNKLTGSIFSFGKVDEIPFTTKFKLGESLKIENYQDDNEYAWDIYGNKLQIFNREGKVSSEFIVKDDISLLTGKSLIYRDVDFELKWLSSEKVAKLDESFTENDAFRIQNIIFPTTLVDRTTRRELFYRGDEIGSFGQLNIIDGYNDFNTYINILSAKKWKKYTAAKNFYLKLTIKGKFELEIINHWLNFKSKELQKKGLEKTFQELHDSQTDDIFKRNSMNYQSTNSDIKKTTLKYEFTLDKATEVIIPVEQENESAVLGFTIKGNAEISDAGWYTTVNDDAINPVDIVINTTTFQKEKYILGNLRNIKEQIIDFENKDRGLNQIGEKHLFVNVVDNGRTLDEKVINSDFSRVYGNPNVGGAGGFSRGMIETLNLIKNKEFQPTHVIFMDDDIEVLPESFKRVYSILSLIKPEYKDYFIEGAMLDNIDGITQYEDTGFISKNVDIVYFPTKDRYNQTNLKDVLRNDIEYPVDNEYGAWWYCTVPIKYIHEQAMSLPIFYRGDDIEFSIRNNAKFITLNGLAVWHLPFYTKKSKALENYLVPRNSFIDQSINGFVQDVNYLEKYIELYKKELRMFNYGAASQVLDALDDYLKGPSYVASLNGIETLKKEGKKNEVFSAEIPEEIQKNVHTANEYFLLNPQDMKLFLDTDNGHGLPEIVLNSEDDQLDKVAIVNQDMLDNPGKQFMKKRIAVYDTYNKTYVMRERNQEKYEEAQARFNSLMTQFEKQGDKVAAEYRAAADKFHSKDFWMEHLEKM
ncbi:glycosyltransferase family 2 protein [Lactococcus cremoris]|uniref:glycosyltransferase family 2 protein n=1 Tax=Lactococcus lactis subsp. cremoris TaxID=1359 RepID=UPI0003AB779C|nr:glycosyl transferase GT2 family [Lactococcus cremoris]AGV72866.1 glycosyl transferase GT2 family [Lactococcus cremoris subsp. cremoris KW2]